MSIGGAKFIIRYNEDKPRERGLAVPLSRSGRMLKPSSRSPSRSPSRSRGGTQEPSDIPAGSQVNLILPLVKLCADLAVLARRVWVRVGIRVRIRVRIRVCL